MRSPQRRTLVEKEGWLLIDGWYICPLHVARARIEETRKTLPTSSLRWGKVFMNPHRLEFANWAKREIELEARLAHACKDGKVRAPDRVQHFTKKSGMVSIYGKCRHCNEKLTSGVIAVILMDEQ